MSRIYRRAATLLGLMLLLALSASPPSTVAHAQVSGFALRFFGTGRDGVDRVLIPLDAPGRPVDVGGDFTLEFWMKAEPGANKSAECAPGSDSWIYGNIILDRDVYGPGDSGDYGVALYGGRIAFGVHNGASGATLCGATDVADGAWHHIALTRSAAGPMALFVDGRQDAKADGPPGDISYRDGRGTAYPNDPFLVIGAEKHDAGPEYPSFQGWIDELRISSVVRYQGDFPHPGAPFTPDEATVGLYHFDEGAGDAVADASGAPGGPSDGRIRYGGDPRGPEWSPDTPWSAAAPSPNSAPATPAPQPVAAQPEAPAEAWSFRFVDQAVHEAHGATIVKTDPLAVTELLSVTADGFETNSGDAFVFTTAPLYQPLAFYTVTRTDLVGGSSSSNTVTATEEGRLSLRLPPGRLRVAIATQPIPPTPVVVPTAAPAPAAPPAAAPATPPAAAPAAPPATSASPGFAARIAREPLVGIGIVGLIIACFIWLRRARSGAP